MAIREKIEGNVEARLHQPGSVLMADVAALSLARDLAEIADKKKGEEIVILDVTGRHSLFDLFVIVTAHGARLTQIIGDECSAHARKQKVPRHLEVAPDWVCGDFGDVVLHVFSPEARRYYDLEHLWADAKRVSLSAATA